MSKNKHLTNEDRSQVEHWLRARESIKSIALRLGKSTSTISREIKKNSVPSDKSAPGRIPNRCIMRRDCHRIHLCEDKPDCNKSRCSACKLCNTVCPDFKEEFCARLVKPPYVCNGCEIEHMCTLRKRYYLHRPAQKAYEDKLIDCRSGFNIEENELIRLDKFMSPLILNGHSPHHIFANNPDQFNCCEKTLYRYIDAGLLLARNIDLPRVVRLKPRKTKSQEYKIDKKCRIGRTYNDFLEYMEANPDTATVEMDTVEGQKGGSVLLTMQFNNCGFMLAFLREHNTSQSVIDIFNDLYSTLGKDVFRRLFPIILTDYAEKNTMPKKRMKALF